MDQETEQKLRDIGAVTSIATPELIRLFKMVKMWRNGCIYMTIAWVASLVLLAIHWCPK